MKKFLLICSLFFAFASSPAQTLSSGNKLLDDAFRLAVWTLDTNTHNGIIHAGAGYGGEWTRDCAINCWNAASLLRPHDAQSSLWSVTIDSLRIGHQYWDKIIWVMAAYNHWLTNFDSAMLRKAYACGVTTINELINDCFDSQDGLFMGPAVFQDGIAGYDQPVFDPAKWDDSFVLHHPNSRSIKCLSTNIAYYLALCTLSQMDLDMFNLGVPVPDNIYLQHALWSRKAASLAGAIRSHFFQPDSCKLYYLIDHLGTPHQYQEGLGLALALMTDIFTSHERLHLIQNAYVSPLGIPCVYPSFPRYSDLKPGRHNMMIWPHVNSFFAHGCAMNNCYERFYSELYNMANLAINHGNSNFYEIYTLQGQPSGGYQCGALWDPKPHQTWCATGFINLIVRDVFGLQFTPEGISFYPIGIPDSEVCSISGLPFRNTTLNITLIGHGKYIRSTTINGVEDDYAHFEYPDNPDSLYNIIIELSSTPQ
ncbi:MAG: hypothetical protein MJZ99_08205 [Bacteroidales bacterium]|nr:hypothetical protein [Bacteroidales bacterium]